VPILFISLNIGPFVESKEKGFETALEEIPQILSASIRKYDDVFLSNQFKAIAHSIRPELMTEGSTKS
jgi:hypothetical protein